MSSTTATTSTFVPTSSKKRRATTTSAPKKTKPPKVPKARKSDSSATSKRSSVNSSDKYAVGQIVAIKGKDKKTWLGKIKSLTGDDAEVNWFDELGSQAGTFALLKWEDTIPVKSILGLMTVLEDRKRGVFVLQGNLPV